MYFNNNIYVLLVLYFLNQQIWTVFLRSTTIWWGGSNQGQIWKVCHFPLINGSHIPDIMHFFNKSYFPYFRFHTRSKESTKKILIICRHLNLVKKSENYLKVNMKFTSWYIIKTRWRLWKKYMLFSLNFVLII